MLSLEYCCNNAANRYKKRRGKKTSLFAFEPGFDRYFTDYKQRIQFEIEYTDRSWGVELRELVGRTLQVFLKTDRIAAYGLRCWLSENFNYVQRFSSLLSLFSFFFGFYLVAEHSAAKCVALIDQTDGILSNPDGIEGQISFLTYLVGACASYNIFPAGLFSVLGFIFVAIAFVLPAIIYFFIRLPNYRFLLFTEASKEARDFYFRKINNRRSFWLYTVTFGLVLAVVGNLLTKILFGG